MGTSAHGVVSLRAREVRTDGVAVSSAAGLCERATLPTGTLRQRVLKQVRVWTSSPSATASSQPRTRTSTQPAISPATRVSRGGAEFVSMFERVLEHFAPRIHPEIVAMQPMAPVVHGHAAFEQMFRRFFALLPDLTLTVDRWAARGDAVFVESTCRGSLGGKPIEFSVCDRFVLSDGLIVDRRAYLDPSSIMRALFTRPRSWLRVLSILFRRA